MEEKKKVAKYMTLYMPLGLCLGMSVGLMLGQTVFHNLALGLSIGMSLGMGIGVALGATKDKKMSEKMMKISRIEDVPESTDKFVYAIDENGEEKEYRMNEKRIISEKFSVGDRVAEEKAGYLVSLESK